MKTIVTTAAFSRIIKALQTMKFAILIMYLCCTLANSTLAAVDTTSPSLSSAKTFDDDHDGNIDRISITVIEEESGLSGPCSVNGWSSTDDCSVDMCTVVDGTHIDLAVSGCTLNKTSITPSVNYDSTAMGSDTYDLDGNELVSASVLATDGAAPIISSIHKFLSATDQIVISWVTNENSTTLVNLFTDNTCTTPYVGYVQEDLKELSLTTQHSAYAYNLAVDTIYYYNVTSADAAGNSATSTGCETFTTLQTDTNGPMIVRHSPSTGTVDIDGSVTMKLLISENATCKYDTVDDSYANLVNTFTTTGATIHLEDLSGLVDGSYMYYVRCMDIANNEMLISKIISFTVDLPDSGDVTPPQILSVVYRNEDTATVDIDKIVITYSENVILDEYENDDWLISIGSNESNAVVVGGNTIELTVDWPDNVTGDLWGTPTLAYVAANGVADSVNDTINGAPDYGPVAIIDGADPVIITATVLDADGDGSVDSADLTFSENIDFSTFSPGEFTIDGNTVNSLENGGDADDDTTLKLILTDDVNEVAGLDAKDIVFTNDGDTVGLDGNNVTDALIVGVWGVPSAVDLIAPTIISFLPSSTTLETDGEVSLQVISSENATCKYDTVDDTFANLANTFTTTGAVNHSESLTGLAGGNYQYYVRCSDAASNEMSVSTLIEFTVNNPPIASPAGGSYNNSVAVALSSVDASYVCYSDDSISPECNWNTQTCTFGTKYTGTLNLASSITLKAVSCNQAGQSTESVNVYAIVAAQVAEVNGGGGSGGGGGGSRSSFTPYSLPTQRSITPVVLLDRSIDLPSDGVFAREVIMNNTRSGISTHFPIDTKVTDKNGAPYSGLIKSPVRLLFNSFPSGNVFDNHDFIFGFSLGSENVSENIFFDKEVEIYIPLPDRYRNRDDLPIYYYNEEAGEYVKIDQSKISLSSDGKELIILANHFTKFALVDHSTKSAIVNPPAMGDSDDLKNVAIIPFKDISGHWSESNIATMYKLGVVHGINRNTFAPDLYLTRAELVKIAVLSFGLDVDDNVSERPFSDVSITAWYAPYVKVAKENGLIGNNGSGRFRPEDTVTRVEALKIVLEASGININGGQMIFADTEPGQWYEKYIAYAQSRGILQGYQDGYFGPANSITRAEIAKVIVKIMAIDK